MGRFDFRTRTGLVYNIIQSSIDADSQAFFNRVTAAGGTLSSLEQNSINQLVVDLKAYGLWDSMKAIYPMVGASAAACAQNLKSSSFTGTFTSGWTFSSQGIQGNATSTFMDTSLNDLTDLGANATIGCYLNLAGILSEWDLGIYQAPNIVGISVNNSGQTYINIKTAVAPTFAESIFIGGLYLGTTNGTNSLSYKNATLQNTSPQTTTGLNFNHYIGALNNSGVSFLSTNRRNAFTFFANANFNATNVSNLYTAIQTFQTTLSRQV